MVEKSMLEQSTVERNTVKGSMVERRSIVKKSVVEEDTVGESRVRMIDVGYRRTGRINNEFYREGSPAKDEGYICMQCVPKEASRRPKLSRLHRNTHNLDLDQLSHRHSTQRSKLTAAFVFEAPRPATWSHAAATPL